MLTKLSLSQGLTAGSGGPLGGSYSLKRTHCVPNGAVSRSTNFVESSSTENGTSHAVLPRGLLQSRMCEGLKAPLEQSEGELSGKGRAIFLRGPNSGLGRPADFVSVMAGTEKRSKKSDVSRITNSVSQQCGSENGTMTLPHGQGAPTEPSVVGLLGEGRAIMPLGPNRRVERPSDFASAKVGAEKRVRSVAEWQATAAKEEKSTRRFVEGANGRVNLDASTFDLAAAWTRDNRGGRVAAFRHDVLGAGKNILIKCNSWSWSILFCNSWSILFSLFTDSLLIFKFNFTCPFILH